MFAVPAGTKYPSAPSDVYRVVWICVDAGADGGGAANAGVDAVSAVAATVVPATSEIVATTRTARRPTARHERRVPIVDIPPKTAEKRREQRTFAAPGY
jgi:hypothetical protein